MRRFKSVLGVYFYLGASPVTCRMRQFSLTRRRKEVVDLLINIDPTKNPPVYMWQFEGSVSFNGPFSVLTTMGNGGTRSRTVKDFSYRDGFRGKVRFVWNPVDFVAMVPGISDDLPIFLRLRTKDVGSGVFGPPGAIHIVTPYDPSAHPPVHLSGDAPAAASLSGALELQLPRNCHQFIFENLGGVNMFLAISSAGPEYKLKPGTILELFDTTSSAVTVRGEGASAEFCGVCTIQNSTDIA
jgi:hypothetical protein